MQLITWLKGFQISLRIRNARNIGLALLFINFFVTTIAVSADQAQRLPESPINVEFIGLTLGERGENQYAVRLRFMNQYNEPVWFVLPYWGDQPLNENGVFANKDWGSQPFGGKQFKGEGGNVVQVNKFGSNKFVAFRLPANGKIELDGYEIICSRGKEIDQIVVMVARGMVVNRKTALEDWLPYGTNSDANVKITGKTLRQDWKNLDWDVIKNKSRTDYPSEKVDEVKAEGVTRWNVKFR